MSDLEEYISSGIVESYVLGLTDEKETLEFEKLLFMYPQLKTVMRLFENHLEETIVAHAIPPPAHLWNTLQTRIGPERSGRSGHRNGNGNGKDGDTVIPIVSSDQIRVHKNFRYAFIALIILSKLFLYAAIYYYLLYKDEMKQRIRLENQFQQAVPSSAPKPPASVTY